MTATGSGQAPGGYAPVNGLNLYYEVHGAGAPLVLLHGGFGAILAEWERYSCLTGRTVTVESGGRRTQGTVRGVDAEGRLVLAGPSGDEALVAGDVTIVDGYARPGGSA